MTEWTELTTLQDVAAAQSRGDEIEFSAHKDVWSAWAMDGWSRMWRYRSRPKKPATKMVVMREYFFNNLGSYGYAWTNLDVSGHAYFICWTGDARTEEVPP